MREANPNGGNLDGIPRIQQAAVRIYQQVPGLATLGLALWMAWNDVAFSGSFWLQETDNSFVAEYFKLEHLLVCVVVLALFAIRAKRSTRLVTNNVFAIVGAAIASAGTFGMIWSHVLGGSMGSVCFHLSSVLTGFGTTAIFMRATALFGSLPPKRALAMLAINSMLAAGIYFVMAGLPNAVALVCFVLLPLLAVPFLLLRGGHGLRSERSLRTDTKATRGFVVFLLSILLCSAAFETLRSYALVGIPPENAFSAAHFAAFINIIVMLGVVCLVLVLDPEREPLMRLYTIACAILAILLAVIAALKPDTVLASSVSIAGITFYNLIVWAFLSYIVYQSQSSSVFVFGIGNAALSFGTVLGIFVVMGYQQGFFDDGVMLPLMLFLDVSVFVDIVFVFNQRRMENLILPIEEARQEGPAFGDQAKRLPKQWILDCKQIAADHGLSPREEEVFIELARGLTADEIAEKESVSVYTVRAHTRSIYTKLDVHSKKELRALVEEKRDGGT